MPLAVLLGLLPGLAASQVQVDVTPTNDHYTSFYGPAADVELSQIADNPGSYQKRNVRTRGSFEMLEANNYWVLRAGGSQVLVLPVPELAGSDLSAYTGRTLQVTGVVRELMAPQRPCRLGHWSLCEDPELPQLPDLTPDRIGWPRVSITAFSLVEIPASVLKPSEAPVATLEALVSSPGKREGQFVKVVGKFRGRNLYGDLPIKSQRNSDDWVIKDDLYAVWVTGKKPKGSGFELDTGLRRDTGKWLEVVGRVETRNGVVYLRAQQVVLTTAPTAAAEVQAPAPLPERPKLPPVVVFALPLDGDGAVPASSHFQVQFSKDMDETTFQGRVLLRYAGPPRPGDHSFDALKLSYGKRQTLTIDPGNVLRAGRQIELLLLPGIRDVDGLDLLPRAGKPGDEAVDVLRFQVAS
jgi:hypothetical protein